MISVAILGEYRKDDAIYAINSLLNQDNVEIELILSNDLDFPICELIDALNIHYNNTIKNVLINIDDCSQQNHLQYISEHMSGDGLLCLWNGSAIYDNNSITNCVENYQGEFVVGKNVLYKRKSGYYAEIPSTSDPIEALQTVLQVGYNGGIILPKEFVLSENFSKIENWDEEIITAISNYINSDNVKEKVVISQYPLIKCYVSTFFRDKNYEVKKFVEENIAEWRMLVEKKQLRLNYSSYVEICGLINLVKSNRNAIRLIAEKRIRQIVLEGRDSAWGITDSNKALIVYLKELCIIRHRENLRWELLKFRMGLNFHKKVKIAMVVVEHFSWMSCYKSIYDELNTSKNKRIFDVDIIYTPDQSVDGKQDSEFEKWENSGLKVLGCDNYDIASECPDVILFYKPYDVQNVKWCAKEIYKAVKKIIYIPNSVVLNTIEEKSVYQNFNLPMHLLAWKILVNSKKYSELIDKYAYQKNNKLLIGHPEYDITMDKISCQDNEMNTTIKKMAGDKRIVFFCIKFELCNDERKLYHFLKEFLAREDVLIVWKVPTDFLNILKNDDVSQELKELITYGQKNKFLYIDNTNSYWSAFFSADVIITDLKFVVERYIIRNIPIFYWNKEAEYSHLNEVIYNISSYEEISNQLRVLLEKDDLLEIRRGEFVNENYYLPYEEENVATRLLNMIKESFEL